MELANPSFSQLNTRAVERDIYDGDPGLDASEPRALKAKI